MKVMQVMFLCFMTKSCLTKSICIFSKPALNLTQPKMNCLNFILHVYQEFVNIASLGFVKITTSSFIT